MDKCKKCYHKEVCIYNINHKYPEKCMQFKNEDLVVELPCQVGDTIYKLWYTTCHNGEDHPDSYTCCGCEDDCDMKRTIIEVTVPDVSFIIEQFVNKQIFKGCRQIYFINKEEAEKALKEYKSNCG